jgi:hypothetical protein
MTRITPATILDIGYRSKEYYVSEEKSMDERSLCKRFYDFILRTRTLTLINILTRIGLSLHSMAWQVGVWFCPRIVSLFVKKITGATMQGF